MPARPLARPTANFANPFGSEIVVVVVVFGSGFWRSAKNASMTRPFYVKRRRRAADATRERERAIACNAGKEGIATSESNV